MTGQYPNTCVRSFGVNLPHDIPTFSGTLRDQGYTTKAIGKMHLSFWFRKLQEDAESPEYIADWMNPNTHDQMVKDFPSPYYGFDSMELVVGHGDICNGHYQDWVAEQDPSVLQTIRALGPNILTQLYRKSDVPEASAGELGKKRLSTHPKAPPTLVPPSGSQSSSRYQESARLARSDGAGNPPG